jgi:hypothetical protein
MGLTIQQITREIDRRRELHPELAHALTWNAMQQICAREGVALRVSSGRMPRLAQLVPCFGAWTIVLSQAAPPRRHTYLAAHELGHLWLHHDRQHERTEVVYNMDQHWPDDPREDDAELFAALVLMGPRRTPMKAAETHIQHALRTMRVPRGPKP